MSNIPPPLRKYGRSKNILWVLLGLVAMILLPTALMSPTASVQKARKVTSFAIASALESSINALYTEYGAIPGVGNQVTTDSPEGRKLLVTLLGLDEKSDKPLNSRAIRFLSVKEGKSHKNGLVHTADGTSVEGLYDSWGSPFAIELNDDPKKPLHFTVGSRDVDLKERLVAVYSPGPDRIMGTVDDVRTW